MPAAVTIAAATASDAEALAELAAATFPLACPPGTAEHEIQAYLARALSTAAFRDHLADPARTLLIARPAAEFRPHDHAVAYAMLVHRPPEDPDIAATVTRSPSTEISKFYARSSAHGSGAAALLMGRALELCRERGDAGVWLGVNHRNARAQRFYRKHGFEVVGTRAFTLGAELHDDYLMARGL